MVSKGEELCEKELRGLPISEFVEVLNRCFRDGKLNMVFYAERSTMKSMFTWTHEPAGGIPITIEYYRSRSPRFRVIGNEWSVTFDAAFVTFDFGNRPLDEGFLTYLGPLTAHGSERNRAELTKFHVKKLRRRGKLARFKHDFTLIRLFL
jgi:hypothetical protein